MWSYCVKITVFLHSQGKSTFNHRKSLQQNEKTSQKMWYFWGMFRPTWKNKQKFHLETRLLNTEISKIAFRTSFLNSDQDSKFLVMLMTTRPSRVMSKWGSTILSCIYQKSSQKVQIVQNSKVQTMQDFLTECGICFDMPIFLSKIN